MKTSKYLFIIPALLLQIAFVNAQADDLPADKKATKETISLYRNLKRSLDRGIMFGHQDDYAYGVQWKYEAGRSDIKDVTGDYPAVMGCEIGRIELDWNKDLDGVPFDSTRRYIQQAYERGTVITMSWHLNNPYNGKTAWEPDSNTVKAILTEGKTKEVYTKWLDRVAAYLQSVKDKNGVVIPIIFRPFHELNGSWFWWGKNHCTPAELKQLYQYTEHYLRDIKNVHNLLYAYNTDRFATRVEFMERYPGDEWIDVIGFDIYQKGDVAKNEDFIRNLDTSLTIIEAVAREHNKIPALTEFGYNEVPDSTWWTKVLWQGIKNHRIAYALAWRNAGDKGNGEMEYWVPFTGQQSAADFKTFYRLPKTLFAGDVAKENLYDSKK